MLKVKVCGHEFANGLETTVEALGKNGGGVASCGRQAHQSGKSPLWISPGHARNAADAREHFFISGRQICKTNRAVKRKGPPLHDCCGLDAKDGKLAQ